MLWVTSYQVGAGEKNPVRAITVREFDQALKQSQDEALIVVLAAWCAPCRKELPLLVRLHRQYKPKGLKMIGMSVDYGGISAIQPIIDRYGVPFPVFWVGEEAIAHYGISAIPLLMLVENGAVSDRITGVQTEEQLEALVNRIID